LIFRSHLGPKAIAAGVSDRVNLSSLQPVKDFVAFRAGVSFEPPQLQLPCALRSSCRRPGNCRWHCDSSCRWHCDTSCRLVSQIMESESSSTPPTPSSACQVSDQSEYPDIHTQVTICNPAGACLQVVCRDDTTVNELILKAKKYFHAAGPTNSCSMALNTKILNPRERILDAILDRSDKLDGTILTFIVAS